MNRHLPAFVTPEAKDVLAVVTVAWGKSTFGTAPVGASTASLHFADGVGRQRDDAALGADERRGIERQGRGFLVGHEDSPTVRQPGVEPDYRTSGARRAVETAAGSSTGRYYCHQMHHGPAGQNGPGE